MSNPQIIYTLITYNKQVSLCDFSEFTGNFQLNCLKIIKSIQKDHSASLDYQRYKFNYTDNNNLSVICLANNDFPLDICYCFLQEVLNNFKKLFSDTEIQESKSHYEFNSKFSHILKDTIKKYNARPQCTDNLTILSNEIHSFMKNVLSAENLLNQRGEILQDIVVQSEKLISQSDNYYTAAKRVKNKEICNKWVWYIFAFLVVCLICYFISVLSCGWDYSKC